MTRKPPWCQYTSLCHSSMIFVIPKHASCLHTCASYHFIPMPFSYHSPLRVIPTKVGIQFSPIFWIPVFTGMTEKPPITWRTIVASNLLFYHYHSALYYSRSCRNPGISHFHMD